MERPGGACGPVQQGDAEKFRYEKVSQSSGFLVTGALSLDLSAGYLVMVERSEERSC